MPYRAEVKHAGEFGGASSKARGRCQTAATPTSAGGFCDVSRCFLFGFSRNGAWEVRDWARAASCCSSAADSLGTPRAKGRLRVSVRLQQRRLSVVTEGRGRGPVLLVRKIPTELTRWVRNPLTHAERHDTDTREWVVRMVPRYSVPSGGGAFVPHRTPPRLASIAAALVQQLASYSNSSPLLALAAPRAAVRRRFARAHSPFLPPNEKPAF